MGARLFGTDGIRGRANEGPLTPGGASAFGRAIAVKFGAPGRAIAIGRDTRESGPMLEQAVAQGIAEMGVNVALLGVLPTPAIAVMSRELKACAAVVISASHNPWEDNGLKLFNEHGFKCDDALELELEGLILGEKPRAAKTPGKIESLPDAAVRYVDLAVATYGKNLDLRGVKVVVDCGHGAAYETTPLVLRALGAEVIALNVTPTGTNINDGCGSTHPEAMAAETVEAKANIGLAHDGDADRLIVCDETGSLLDGDEMLAVIGLDLLREGKLAKKTLVATVMSNLGLDECFAAAGGTILRSGVGDRYVLEQMLALELLRIMKRTGKPLSELRQGLRKYPQQLVNVKVRERIPLEQIPEISNEVRAVEKELGTQGRVLLRYSGTEPKIRLLVETRDEAMLQPVIDRLLRPIKKHLGV
jgi:phosphoglucosamine mutase